jgi:CHASE3 domain sensor protein
MQLRSFEPVFRKLIVLPLMFLGLLGLVLVYGLRSVEKKSLAVDEADLVIAHSNNLIKLMIDEETELRGYLLTKNPVFLQPFHVADRQLDSEFAALSDLIKLSPDEMQLLKRLKADHEDWTREANGEIASPSTGVPGSDFLLNRKREMDGIRMQMDRILNSAENKRSQTLYETLRSNRIILFGSADFAILIVACFIWQTQAALREIVRIHLELQTQSSNPTPSGK